MKKIAILGAGESGVGAAILGMKQGLEVFVSDSGKVEEKYRNVLSQFEIKWEEEGHSYDLILEVDEVIKSPGIPDSAELIIQLKNEGVPVISEIEFAGRYTKAKIIGITGSNGKTTTTLLTHHILQNAGLNVGLAGNVGESFAKQVAMEDHDYYVIELSSFQLDGIFDLKIDIAVLLNVTPDHLDRYENDFNKYVESKFRICQNQDETQVFIYNDDDEVIKDQIDNKNIASKLIPFSIQHELEQGAFINKSEIEININQQKFDMSIQELALQGKHNLYNSMAAGIISRVLDIRKEVIRESLTDFQNVEHRLEFVAKVHDIEFINDSKATNVNATWFALESISKPIIWIVGGVDKGNDYSQLTQIVRERVNAIICLGENNKKIHKAFKDSVPEIHDTRSATEAVAMAYRLGKKGEVVLLSPACASFDLFENYEDRGQQFKKAVKSL